MELVFHRYWQYHASVDLKGARIRSDPLGQDSSIGNEWDLIIGIEEWQRLELELVGSLFIAGDAFGPLSGQTARSMNFSINYNF